MTPDGSWIRDEDLEPLTRRLQQRTAVRLAQELQVFYEGMAPEKVLGAGEVAACYSDDTELLNASLLLTYGACLPLEPPALERARARAQLMRSEKLLEEQREQHQRLEGEWRERERVAEDERQRLEEEQARRISVLEQQLAEEKRAAGERQQQLQAAAEAQEGELMLQQQQLGQQLANGQDALQRIDLELQQHFALLEAMACEGETASAEEGTSSAAARAEKRNAANVSSPLQGRVRRTRGLEMGGGATEGLDVEMWK